MLRAIIAGMLIAVAARAQSAEKVPLGNRAYDVFELTAAAPEHVYTLQVSHAARLVLDVRTPAVPVDLQLLAPDGTPVDPATFTRLTLADADVPPLGVMLFEQGAHVQATVANPAAGAWTVRISLPAGQSATLGSATALMTGGLGVSAFTSRPEYAVGDPAVIALAAFDGSAPVAGATAFANVYQAGAEDTPTVVALRDDGVAPDSVAGDGLYTGQIASAAPGTYLVEGVLQGAAARATAGATFQVTPPLARFTGNVRDSGVDLDFDGLFDQIAIALDLAVDSAGSYAVTVVLRKDARTLVGGANATLAPGARTISARFAAADVKSFLAADGPYEIAEATLIRRADGASPEHVADRRTGLGSTAAYTLAQLQRPLTLIRPGLQAQGVDTDANGLFDLLHVTFEVDTRRAGFYIWSGDLRAADGTVLGIGSGSGFLAAGVTTVALDFEGRPVGVSGLDGPYLVGNVAIYGPPESAAVSDELGRTQALSSAQFEGGAITFARLIAEVSRVPITGRGGIPRAQGIRTSLLKKLDNAQAASLRGNAKASRSVLEAFVSELDAQAGQHVAAADAARLADLARRLETQL